MFIEGLFLWHPNPRDLHELISVLGFKPRGPLLLLLCYKLDTGVLTAFKFLYQR